MEASFLTQWFSDHEIKAICWTLIHSLWIGVIGAVLVGMLISFIRKSSANIRYRGLCGILVLFVMAMGLTYYFQVRTTDVGQQVINTHNVNIKHADFAPIQHVGALPHQSVVSQAVGFLNQNMNIIFLVWLLFFILKSLKMAGGLLYIQRIRNYRVHDVAEKFKHKIELFGSQIGIRQTVRLMQSELVKVPVAVGWLKPVILLPVGILLQLSTEQLESILWHELAHIRRRDYLVNILQGLVETIFFFNPGLLWLSSLIRAEREACCDDIVLSRMNRKANYLEALLAFGYEDNSRAVLAMSIGSGNQLRDRLKRMVNQENKRLSVAEKVVLAVGLVLLSAFTTISKDNPVIKHLIVKFTNRSGKVVTKTMAVSMHRLPKGQRVNNSKPGTHEKDTIRVTDTTVRFTSVLFKHSDADLANNDIKAMDVNGKRYHFIVANNKLVAMEIDDVKVNESQLANYQYMIRYIDRVIAEKRRFIAGGIDRFKASSPAATLKKFDKKNDSLRFKTYDTQSKFYNDRAKFLTDQKGPDPKYGKLENILKRRHDDSLNYAEDLSRMRNVIADLVAEKVVSKASDIKWFGLSSTEFIVNGQKQADERQQRFKAKYGVREDYGLYYGPVQMTGKGVFIDQAEAYGAKSGRLALPRKQLQDQQDKLQYAEPGIQQFKQQRNMARLDAQQKGFFHPTVPLNDIIANVTDDLVGENVIKDKSDLASFKLTNRFLTVNGKKQSAEIYEKLKNKYLSRSGYELNPQIIKDPNFGVHYDVKTGSMGIGIDIERDDP